MSELPTAILGNTGLEVTKLGFGAMELRGPGGAWPRDIDDTTAGTILNQILDSGVNWIDTAPDYGLSEGFIGKHISGRRGEYLLASKCGCVIDPSGAELESDAHDFRRANIRAAVEQSLRRMKTDHLDLVQLHSNPSRATLEENDTIAEMMALRDEGKTRFIGVSGVVPNTADHIDMGVFDAIQVPYSPVETQHADALHRAAAAGIGTIVRNSVARGVLDASPEKIQGMPEGWRDVWVTGRDRFEQAGLDDLMDGMSRSEFAIRYVITNPDVHTTIIGSANPQHMASNIAAAQRGVLSQDVYGEAKRRLEGSAVK